KGSLIFRTGEVIYRIGLVLEGSVNIVVHFFWGNSNIFGHIEKGKIFGEAYAAIPGKELPCDVVAAEDSKILFLDFKKIMTTCPNCCAFHTRIIHNIVRISASKNINLSSRMMLIAPKSIRDKLLSYLSEQAMEHANANFSIPFSRQQLEDYLGVDRSALSNELSKMQKDGLITYQKNHFILHQDYSPY
ncbi:MAG: Crp/Fnr family transcriptional regulator, partial [Bacillota bacterium]|nr:Crp/Fnr family transcriptional regulator [Bacillota bacterium]